MNVYQSWIPETKSVQINECLSIINTWNQFCPNQWMFIDHEYLKPILSKSMNVYRSWIPQTNSVQIYMKG